MMILRQVNHQTSNTSKKEPYKRNDNSPTLYDREPAEGDNGVTGLGEGDIWL